MQITTVTNTRGMAWAILAGAAAAQTYLTRLAAQVAPAGALSLVAFQEAAHADGFRGVKLVRSMYGWRVRFASGLDGFDLLGSVREGSVDGSFSSALTLAERWAAEDEDRRWVEIAPVDLAKAREELAAAA